MGDVLDLLLSRRSIGKVLTDPVPHQDLRAILRAATAAPNHHLTVPWRFVVLTGAARRTIGEAHLAATMRQRPDLDGPAREREAARLERAPAVIACIVTTGQADVVRAREDRDAVAAAVQNLLIAAHARGFGAIWRTGSMVDEPEVRDALGLGGEDAIVAFVYLGVPAATLPERDRPPLDAVVEWRDR